MTEKRIGSPHDAFAFQAQRGVTRTNKDLKKMIIAYIRKSTEKQAFSHMEYEIKQYASQNNITIDRWIEESISSRKPYIKGSLEHC